MTMGSYRLDSAPPWVPGLGRPGPDRFVHRPNYGPTSPLVSSTLAVAFIRGAKCGRRNLPLLASLASLGGRPPFSGDRRPRHPPTLPDRRCSLAMVSSLSRGSSPPPLRADAAEFGGAAATGSVTRLNWKRGSLVRAW
jgi:hypothetical protein